MPFPLIAAAAAVPSVFKAIGGLFGAGKGRRQLNRLMKNVPGYDIPAEFNENVNIGRDLAAGMPKAQYMQAQQNIGRNQAFGLSALQDRRSALAGIGRIVRQSNDATLALDAQSANMARQGQQILMGANQALAGQKLNKQQWEKFNPWTAQVAQAQGRIGAGQQNFMGGLDNLAALGVSAFSNPNFKFE